MDEETLRNLFTECDVGWVFEEEGDEDASKRAQQISAEMYALAQHYANTLGERRPLPEPIDRLILSDVARFKPLVQSFAPPLTTEIRTLIFCLLDGAHIEAIRFEYDFKQRAHLEVEVGYDNFGGRACFRSDEVWDVEVLRHFGVFKVRGKPVIDGYYAFRTSQS
jgi:hypothetical protein